LLVAGDGEMSAHDENVGDWYSDERKTREANGCNVVEPTA
jgi:hypothetical protein